MKKNFVIKKNKNFKHSLIIIDGFSGSGKTLIAPIISTYKDVQNQAISYDFDNIVKLNYLKKIDNQTSSEILKFTAQELLYNNEIGRKINLRKFDHTGVDYNPKAKHELKKLKIKNTNQILNKIKKKNLTLTLMSHKIFLNAKLLNNVFKKNLILIICVRHPVFLFRHYFNYFKKIHNTEKDFSINIELGRKKFPWYFLEINTKQSNKLGDNILTLFNFLFKKIKKLKEKESVIIVDFEKFISKPKIFLDEIEKNGKFIKDKSLLKKAFLLSKIPRKKINSGITYVTYGINNKKISDKQFYKKELKFIKKNISNNSNRLLLKLISEYNKTWPNDFRIYE